MKNIRVFVSALMLALILGQGAAIANEMAKAGAKGKMCKCNFAPGNKKHASTAPVK